MADEESGYPYNAEMLTRFVLTKNANTLNLATVFSLDQIIGKDLSSRGT